ncbi:hypothetical protein THAOC_32923 [Thalassiosira oceanica]|uniref:Uncharacterized protein n=1 Tax=Thalassiosira oceanica TaxID=159749 RepID=K0R681_THAOC|nr:hypothetical protein THAOC_32923 [Thalassiosira oceanica]|eukprot:EJK48295.1 hypothetical protein THAOC_32923 [Thalassiosira oceanica]
MTRAGPATPFPPEQGPGQEPAVHSPGGAGGGGADGRGGRDGRRPTLPPPAAAGDGPRDRQRKATPRPPRREVSRNRPGLWRLRPVPGGDGARRAAGHAHRRIHRGWGRGGGVPLPNVRPWQERQRFVVRDGGLRGRASTRFFNVHPEDSNLNRRVVGRNSASHDRLVELYVQGTLNRRIGPSSPGGSAARGRRKRFASRSRRLPKPVSTRTLCQHLNSSGEVMPATPDSHERQIARQRRPGRRDAA